MADIQSATAEIGEEKKIETGQKYIFVTFLLRHLPT